MSSEMRELVKRWRDNAEALRSNQPLPSWQRAEEVENCAEELEALLARTEAGADACLSNQDDFTVVDCPKCGTCVQFVRKDAAALRPPVASGDAEDAERYRHIRNEVFAEMYYTDDDETVKHVTWSRSAGRRLDSAIDAAMQAKEAK